MDKRSNLIQRLRAQRAKKAAAAAKPPVPQANPPADPHKPPRPAVPRGWGSVGGGEHFAREGTPEQMAKKGDGAPKAERISPVIEGYLGKLGSKKEAVAARAALPLSKTPFGPRDRRTHATTFRVAGKPSGYFALGRQLSEKGVATPGRGGVTIAGHYYQGGEPIAQHHFEMIDRSNKKGKVAKLLEEGVITKDPEIAASVFGDRKRAPNKPNRFKVRELLEPFQNGEFQNHERAPREDIEPLVIPKGAKPKAATNFKIPDPLSTHVLPGVDQGETPLTNEQAEHYHRTLSAMSKAELHVLAKVGAIKRDWYHNWGKIVRFLFTRRDHKSKNGQYHIDERPSSPADVERELAAMDKDGYRFSTMMASTSPQTPVHNNEATTLGVFGTYSRWKAAHGGRQPTPAEATNILREIHYGAPQEGQALAPKGETDWKNRSDREIKVLRKHRDKLLEPPGSDRAEVRHFSDEELHTRINELENTKRAEGGLTKKLQDELDEHLKEIQNRVLIPSATGEGMSPRLIQRGDKAAREHAHYYLGDTGSFKWTAPDAETGEMTTHPGQSPLFGSWVNGLVSAMTADDDKVHTHLLNGYKTRSFDKNLLGLLRYGTIDVHQLATFDLPEDVAGTHGYHAYVHTLREIAAEKNRDLKHGERPWEAADVQAAIWTAWRELAAKMASEHATPQQALEKYSQADLLNTPDFAEYLTNDAVPQTRSIKSLFLDSGITRDAKRKLEAVKRFVLSRKRAAADMYGIKRPDGTVDHSRPLAGILSSGDRAIFERIANRAARYQSAHFRGGTSGGDDSPEQLARRNHAESTRGGRPAVSSTHMGGDCGVPGTASVRPGGADGRRPTGRLRRVLEVMRARRAGTPERFARPAAPTPAAAMAVARSRNALALANTMSRTLHKLGVDPHKVSRAIHSSNGQFSPAAVASVFSEAPPEAAIQGAAWQGLMTKSPGMVAFYSDPAGPDRMHRVILRGQTGDLSQRLTQAGASSSTIVPTKQGAVAYVYDEGGRLGDRLARSGLEVESAPGRGAMIGSASPAKGRQEMRDIIRAGSQGAGEDQSPVPPSAATAPKDSAPAAPARNRPGDRL